MVYPNYRNKHKEETMVRPEENINKKKLPKDFPRKFIFIYDSKLIKRVIRKYHPVKFKNFFAGGDLYWYKDIAIVKMKGVGSPHATLLFEQAIVCGGKKFINIGIAGGLRKEGFFLCSKSLRDEGTSYHYIPHGKFAYPDDKLTEKLGKSLTKLDIPFEKSASWTIDAPFRETIAEVKKFAKKGISTVEMEASALFAVARLRNVKIASAFVVSDVLGDLWDQRFDHKETKDGLDKLFDAAVDCLNK